MLKYKNRLTPNIYTLQKLLTFYKRKKTSSLLPSSTFTAFWVIQNTKKEKPSFNSIFTNIHFLAQLKWVNSNFKLPLNSLISQKYFSNTQKLPLFSRKVKILKDYPTVSYFESYTGLHSSSKHLIGKPFNAQNSYFFVAKNYEQGKTFKLKPSYSRVIWKTYFLKALKERFIFDTNELINDQSRFKLLTGGSFGGPVPSNNTLFQKPYLFTNSLQKKPFLKHPPSLIFKKAFSLFKSTKKKFVQRRFSWSKTFLLDYKLGTSKYFSLSSFNLLSNVRSLKWENKVKGDNLQSLLNHQQSLINPQSLKPSSIRFFFETVKLLRLTTTLTSLRFQESGYIQQLQVKRNFFPNLNNPFALSAKQKKKTCYGYNLQKLLKKKRNRLFKRKKIFRVKHLRKLIKSPQKLLTPSTINIFLVRPKRWGRKFLRRLNLKKNVNLTTFNLTLLKSVFFLKRQSLCLSKINYSLIKKNFLWKKFLKWRKVKRLKVLSVKQKLIFTNFFLKYLKNCFLTSSPIKKMKFRLTLLKKMIKFPRKDTFLPNLFTDHLFFKGLNTYYSGLQSSYPLVSPISLVSNYGLNFIFPLYGFLFITSSNLTKHQLTAHQILQKKTVHSFFYLNDLKSFIAGKHSTVVNSYNSFFIPTSDLHTNITSSVTGLGNITMANFLTKNFNLTTEEVSNTNFLQPHENDPRIPRIKFKPGYSRIWRRARVGIKEYFQIKFQYQHRLTRFLPQFYKLNQISLIKSTELRLENLLLSSQLLPDLLTCYEFFNSELVFLNGRLVLSGKVYIVRNDLIQLLISMKYYILFKWFTNWEISKKIRLNRLLYLSRLKTKRTFRKTLPDWVLRKISSPYDIPKYIEVDYLTLSAFVLYEPYLLNDFTHIFQKFSRSPIYNVYNWKYLT